MRLKQAHRFGRRAVFLVAFVSPVFGVFCLNSHQTEIEITTAHVTLTEISNAPLPGS
jgi:hypothetical protein